MHLEDLLKTLPHGLHDAWLARVRVDYEENTATFDLEIDISKGREEALQGATLVLSGLEYLVILPPDTTDGKAGMVVIDSWPGIREDITIPFPPAPEGTFVHTLFVVPWNSFMVVCARDAQLVLSPPNEVPPP